MKRTVTLALFFLIAVPTALAQISIPSDPTSINKMAHLAGLTRTDREPRSWKSWLWLRPGKEKFYYYEWILENGSTITKVETIKIKQAPDRRPLADSHPNLNAVLPFAGVAGSAFQGVGATAVLFK